MFPTVALQGGPAHEEMLFIITHQVSAVCFSECLRVSLRLLP